MKTKTNNGGWGQGGGVAHLKGTKTKTNDCRGKHSLSLFLAQQNNVTRSKRVQRVNNQSNDERMKMKQGT
jgi:hypothetical protein